MWDFEVGRTLVLLARTWPFILFRLVVYCGIALAYVIATGLGAGIGYGLGHVVADPDGPPTFAVWGGIGGFALVSAVVYLIREYVLYVVKAGHVAVMVHLIDGRPVPDGQGQIAYARREVSARFAEANVLFVLDQLVKGAVRAIAGLLGGVASLLPIPGLHGLVRFANTVIRLSLTHVDEIVLGYNVRLKSDAPFETARRGVVLYAQNARTMVRNAVWLAIFSWLVSLALFVVMLAPAAAILYVMPGQLAGWSFVFAIVFAWALKAALLEPFAIAAMMSVYLSTIEGQVPDPAWDRRLADASKHFRELKERAMVSVGIDASASRRPA